MISVLCALVLQGLSASGEREQPRLRIAEQYGIAYAPVTVLRQEQTLEEALPGYDIGWIRLANAAAIREAMLAGRVDIGFMGVPPYLIGRDRGMAWHAFTGLAETPLGLVTVEPGVASLKDLVGPYRIALPQPGSIQHILLAMAAERDLGDATVFDGRLVTMAHPDAMQALTTGSEVRSHFASQPYLSRELDLPGARLLLSGSDAFGGRFSFIIGVVSEDFLERHGGAVAVLTARIEEAIERIAGNRDVRVRLAQAYALEIDEFEELLAMPGMRYDTTIRGVDRFREFMVRAGYLTGDAR